MKYKFPHFVLVITIFLFTSFSFAQGNSGGSNGVGPPFPCPPNNPVCGGQPGLPIDGGVIWLVIAGAVLGVYKIYRKESTSIQKKS